MKRILALISVLTVIGLFLIPSGVAFADQVYHTERLPLHVTEEGAAAGYTLRNGMVVNIHANGPNNFAIEEYILNGAKPNTTYIICRQFSDAELWYGPMPIGGERLLPAEGNSITTDKNGNGRCTIKLTPEYLAPVYPRTFHPKFVLIVGGHPDPEEPWAWIDGTRAYETEYTEATLDW